eukprot:366237-Chlamydomonas_euryale.AAC.6
MKAVAQCLSTASSNLTPTLLWQDPTTHRGGAPPWNGWLHAFDVTYACVACAAPLLCSPARSPHRRVPCADALAHLPAACLHRLLPHPFAWVRSCLQYASPHACGGTG